jgi:glycosyltransferase involved in cell wall biosynthesis
VPMPMTAATVTSEGVRRVRARHGLAEDALVVACFGLLTREKRIATVARAVGRLAAVHPEVRLLLVGTAPDPGGLRRGLERLGVAGRTVVAGHVPFPELAAYLAAADVLVHLRYPTARETSAALLRVLAQGRPTIAADLEHLADLPDDVVVKVDVADEEGALTRALGRLAESPAARERLGRRAAAFVRENHSPARTRAGYEEAIALARDAPDPAARPWPSHWTLRPA